MKKLDSFALNEVMKHVEESLEGDSPEELQAAKRGIMDLLQVYFLALDVNNQHNSFDRLLEAREAMRSILHICIESQRTLAYLTRDDQRELSMAFTEILKRIAFTADAHFGAIH